MTGMRLPRVLLKTQVDPMTAAEMLGRDQQVLQRAAEADVQLALVGVGDSRPARPVRVQTDLVLLHLKPPGLRAMAGPGQNGVAEQMGQSLHSYVTARAGDSTG
jgi:hypothetical protein